MYTVGAKSSERGWGRGQGESWRDSGDRWRRTERPRRSFTCTWSRYQGISNQIASAWGRYHAKYSIILLSRFIQLNYLHLRLLSRYIQSLYYPGISSQITCTWRRYQGIRTNQFIIKVYPVKLHVWCTWGRYQGISNSFIIKVRPIKLPALEAAIKV